MKNLSSLAGTLQRSFRIWYCEGAQADWMLASFFFFFWRAQLKSNALLCLLIGSVSIWMLGLRDPTFSSRSVRLASLRGIASLLHLHSQTAVGIRSHISKNGHRSLSRSSSRQPQRHRLLLDRKPLLLHPLLLSIQECNVISAVALCLLFCVHILFSM